MAAQLYPSARKAFLDGDIDWLVHNFRVLLIDKTIYVANFTSDQFLSHVPTPAIIYTTEPLTAKTSVDGVADAADIETDILDGEQLVTAAVIFQDTGVAGTSRLVTYTDSGIGFPLIQSGGPVQIRWSDGPTRIFKL